VTNTCWLATQKNLKRIDFGARTRTVIKTRDVKFFKNQGSINVLTKDPLSMPDDTKAITVANSSNTPSEQSDYQGEEYEQHRE